MEYHTLVRDFIKRTQVNLEVIESCVTDNRCEAFETTQLLNSLLGLLILPQQRYYDSIPHTPIHELIEQGWTIPRPVDDYPQVETLHKLLRYLRNSIAHFNVEFHGDNGQLSAITVWNVPHGALQPDWKARLEFSELRTFIDHFSKLIGDIGEFWQ